MTFDLTPYAGETVILGFRYMTDWYTQYEGWYLGGVLVSGELVNNFEITPEYPIVEFMVTLIYKYTLKYRRYTYTFYCLEDMHLNKFESGKEILYASKDVYMLVSPVRTIGDSDYKFAVNKWCKHWKCF